MTPTEFRERYNEWSKTAPPNDTDIIPPTPRYSASPRHHKFAEELKGLRLWNYISKPVDPLATNWMVADNDNGPNDEDTPPAPKSIERKQDIRPEVEETMDALGGVQFETRIDGHVVPIPGPNVEYGPEKPFSWNSKTTSLTGTTRPVARLGTLRFGTLDSVGKGKELTPCRGALVAWGARPNFYGYRIVDHFRKPLGGGRSGKLVKEIEASNLYFEDAFDAKPHLYGKGRGIRKNPKDAHLPLPPLPPVTMAFNDARAFCGLPPVVPANDNRPGLPLGGFAVRDSFHGIKSTGRDHTGDAETEDWLARTEQSVALRGKLSRVDVTALDAALHASSFADVGNALGYTGKTAERQGKQRLLLASRNLSKIIDQQAP